MQTARIASSILTFEMPWNPGERRFDAVKAAFLSAGTIKLQDRHGDFSVTSFSRKESLNGTLWASVTVEPVQF
jgi:hypothetical protein